MMRAVENTGWACDRTRQAVSLGLDGELSQIERVLMERHFERCPSCATFAADTTSLTGALRAAGTVMLDRPIQLPLRRRAGYVVRHAGAWIAAASVAATALLAVLTLPAHRDVPQGATYGYYMGTNQDLRDLRTLRNAQMKPLALILSRPLHGPQLET
jgi:predicted anti-sigma-YlaC factor YlaD